jgi:hypothetical protein
VPAAGEYWFKFGNLAPTKTARYRFGSISYASGSWSPYQGTPNDDFFDGGVQRNLNYYPSMRITGTAGAGGGGGGGSSKTAEELAAEARENHARDVASANSAIRSTLLGRGELTEQQLIKADVSGVNSRNIKLINADLLKLSTDAVRDMSAVTQIINRYSVVEKVISRQRLSFNDLAQVGLANPASPYRSVVLRELNYLSSDSINTPEGLQAAIVEIEKKAAARRAYIRDRIAKHSQR